MFKTKKFIVFFVAALIGITLCQAAESKMPVKATKTAKGKKAVKPSKVKKSVKPAKAKEDKEKVPGGSICTNYSGERDACKHKKEAAIGLGFCTPLQFPCENTMIEGFRLSALYTYNYGVNGLDCGFICDSGPGGTKGMQAGVFTNRTAGSMVGLSLSLINIAETSMNGVQAGAYNQAGSDSYDNAGANYYESWGTQLGFANVADSIFTGLQLGDINISNTILKGCQIGVINLYEAPSDVFDDFETKEFREEKKKRSCVQIGVFNFNPNGVFPITLLLNF